jgi:hypothetical protein
LLRGWRHGIFEIDYQRVGVNRFCPAKSIALGSGRKEQAFQR